MKCFFDESLPFGSETSTRWRIWLRRDVAEIFLDERACFVVVKVTDDGYHRVVRRVIDPEKLLHVVDRRGVEIFHRSDRRMRVGRIRKDQLVHPEKRVDVRLIVVTQSLLFLDGVALVVEIFLRHFQRPHAIAFEPEREWQLVRRQSLEIVGALGGRCAVHRAAGVEDVLEVRGFRNVFRALKHHVLKQVSKAGAAFFLVARTDVVVNGD